MYNSLGDELRSARLLKGLTVREVASQIKMDYKFAEKMESGDFTFLPEIYLKGFLKQYAGALGLNPDVMVTKLTSIKKGVLPPDAKLPESKPEKSVVPDKIQDPPAVVTKNEDPVTEKPQRGRKKTKQPDPVVEPVIKIDESPAVKPKTAEIPVEVDRKIKLVVEDSGVQEKKPLEQKKRVSSHLFFSGILFIIIVAASIFIYIKNTEDEIIETPSVSQSILDEIESSNPNGNTENGSTFSSDSLYLYIKATDSAWVQIIIDNITTTDMLMMPRDEKFITAGEVIDITIGNSTGIELYLNQKGLEFQKVYKTRQTLKINASGIIKSEF
ncbi:MAG: helix-turn-helix domain-containing protein [Ignavibacteriaceae bacterium]|nr:helix-turn-helix domain-containing protein [Ignavibacteriaceae bacterium]